MIETLIAIFILLVSTTGPLSFAQSGLRASFLARDQVVAFYLAQDAIETLKSLRDNNSLSGQYWLQDMSGCESTTDGCRMQTTGSPFIIEPCFAGSCNPMYYDNSTREFVLASGANREPSKYTRTIFVDEIVPGREAQIIVEVEWDSNFFAERRIVVQENIYNWVPQFTP